MNLFFIVTDVYGKKVLINRSQIQFVEDWGGSTHIYIGTAEISTKASFEKVIAAINSNQFLTI